MVPVPSICRACEALSLSALSLSWILGACGQLSGPTALSGSPRPCAPTTPPTDLALLIDSELEVCALPLREERLMAGVNEPSGAQWWGVIEELGVRR